MRIEATLPPHKGRPCLTLPGLVSIIFAARDVDFNVALITGIAFLTGTVDQCTLVRIPLLFFVVVLAAWAVVVAFFLAKDIPLVLPRTGWWGALSRAAMIVDFLVGLAFHDRRCIAA
jgi:hypothetical protein